MGLYLAKTGASITGVTLSEEQLRYLRNGGGEGSPVRWRSILRDYRSQTGTFDRIVSVGMFEHVGIGFTRNISENKRAVGR